VSNIEVKNGDGVNIGGITTTQQTLKISQPATNVSITKGDVGKDAHYTHEQNAASSTWTVSHGLQKKPSVMIVDSADTVLHGAIDYTDNNNLTINLSAPTSGKAYLN